MKKATLSIVLLASMVLSLACQVFSNLKDRITTESPALTQAVALPTERSDITPAPETGGWIAFENQNNVWIVHPDGNNLIQITSNRTNSDSQIIRSGSLKWSPDGNILAYVQDIPVRTSVYAFYIQSSEIETFIPEIGSGFDWSSGGDRILYDTPYLGKTPGEYHNEGLWELNLADGTSQQIIKTTVDVTTMLNPRFSSEGDYILFTTPCSEVNCIRYGIANYNTGSFVLLSAYNGACAWSPNELTVACSRSIEDSSTGVASQEITYFDMNGNIQKTFPVAGTTYNSIVWSPDGQYLALGYYSNGKGNTDLFLLENGNRHFLTAGLPSMWSPDGRWILTWEFDLSGNPPKSNIVNVESGEIFSLTEGAFPIGQPAIDLNAFVLSPQIIDATNTPAVSADVTITPTIPSPDQASCANSISIMVRDTSKGDYLQICADGNEYEVGPLEKGAFAIGPNKLFFVYVTNSGTVYAARIGETRLTVLGDIKDFLIVKNGKIPRFEFQFFGEHPYTVEVHETVFDQKKLLPIPRRISAPN